MIGQTLSHFRIAAKLGEGGMGTVYRADDTKLGRQVAIKLLPEAVAADPERLARFEREAKVLASLNHSNIAAIYSLESVTAPSQPGDRLARLDEADAAPGDSPADKESDPIEAGPAGPVHFLVMELVEGEDLKQRLDRGPIPVDETLPIALQIAQALEAAHASGIIHRDLKPANVKVTPEGQVKVLDFGLAKALDPEAGEGPATSPEAASPSPAALSMSPTLTQQMTSAGVILGTAAYMSPEQASGSPADRRSDIWSFGVVLAEMLTGKGQFAGETVSHVLASVLKDEPDLEGLSKIVPPRMVDLIERCLRKKPTQRLQAIGDARILLQEFLADPGALSMLDPVESESRPADRRSRSDPRRWVPWAVACITTIAALGLLVSRFRAGPEPSTPLYTDIAVPADTRLVSDGIAAGPVVLSPDGSTLAWVAVDERGTSSLWIRRLDRPEAEILGGTEGAKRPFWSPDSKSLGFFARQRLHTISLQSGSILTLAPVADARGGAWGNAGSILYSPNFAGPILSIAEDGGEPRTVTELDPSRNEGTHRYPFFLPDGKHFLYLARASSGATGMAAIKLGNLETGTSRHLTDAASNPAYASGYLLYSRQSTLIAHAFDPDRLELAGDPIPVTNEVRYDTGFSHAVFSVSQTGLLVFEPGSPVNMLSDLVWMDRQGQVLQTLAEPAIYDGVRLSPDESTAAAVIKDPSGTTDVWLIDLDRSLKSRFTFSDASNAEFISNLAWSPDGRQIAFGSDARGAFSIYTKPLSGTAEPELVLADEHDLWIYDWSSDGEWIGFSRTTHESEDALAVRVTEQPAEAVTLLGASYNEWPFTFSPDVQWLAYCSDESGRREVYVTRFPELDGKWQISTAGGDFPRWRHDARAVFYITPGGTMIETPIELVDGGLEVGAEQSLFEFRVAASGDYTYAVSRDGQRFLLALPKDQRASSRLALVFHWTRLLERP